MSARGLVRVVVTLVVLIVLWGAFALFRGSLSDTATGLALPAVTPADVDRFEILTPDDTLRFVRGVDRWNVNDVAADPEQVRQLFAALSDTAGSSELVARNPASHARLGVDSRGRRLVLRSGDAVVLDLIVGGIGAGFQSAYARLAEAEEVFMVRGPLGGIARRPFESWRDRRIAAVVADQVQRLVIAHRAAESVVTRVPGDSADRWMVGADPADTAAVRRLLGALADVSAIAFATPAEVDSLDFDRPDRRLTVIGRTADTLLTLVIDSTQAGYWVKAGGRPEIFRLDFWRVNELTPGSEALRGSGS